MDKERYRREVLTEIAEKRKEHEPVFAPIQGTDKKCGGCVRFSESGKSCAAIYGPEHVDADRSACRMYWGKEERERELAEMAEKREKERRLAWERNRDEPPRKAHWYKDYYGMPDIPHCPECEEFLGDLEDGRCYFCGSAIEMDERMTEWLKPPEVERMDCFRCGGKETVQFVRSKLNGHKHGFCEKCGMKFME